MKRPKFAGEFSVTCQLCCSVPPLLGQKALLCDSLPPGTTVFHIRTIPSLSFPLIPLGNARVKAGSCCLSSPRLSPGLAILGMLLRPVDEQGNGSAGSVSPGKHQHPPPTATAHRGEGLQEELKMDQIKPLQHTCTQRQGAGATGIYFPISALHIKSRKSEGNSWRQARGAT